MKKKRQSNREVRSIPVSELRVATRDDGSRTVSGIAILYNSRSVDLGGFYEVVAPGALTRTLTESPDVLCLRDHKSELLLGRTMAGTLTLDDQPNGLQFSCTLPNTSAGNDLAESLSRGDISGCSFGFAVVNDTWIEDAEGNILRTLLDVELFEISVTSFPAYPATSAALRSAPPEIRSRIEQSDDGVHESQRDDEADTDCTCDCDACASGNCDECTNSDCDLENCSCSNRSARQRKHLELRLRLLELSSK